MLQFNDAPMSASIRNPLIAQAIDKSAMQFSNHQHTHEYMVTWLGSWRENLREKEIEAEANKKIPIK